jgi:hypothetical protein
MGIKRKRSITTLSPASVSSTAPSDHDVSISPSPFRLLAPSVDMCMGMDHGAAGEIDCWNNPNFPQVVEMLPKHLNSRTRKRVRDGRPDEDAIHGMPEINHNPNAVSISNTNSFSEQTLQKLFSAQKQHEQHQPHSFPPLSTTPTPASSHPRPPSSLSVSSHSSHASKTSQQTQQSLHSFFTSTSSHPLPHRTSNPPLPAPPVLHPTYLTHPIQPLNDPLKCEDCDRPLHLSLPLSISHPDAMDMDVDMLDATHLLLSAQDDEAAVFGCLECGRKVCDTCSIRDGGDSRMCLGCACAVGRNGGGHAGGHAGGKRWVGGIGWM